ncbi:MAG: hypothetical protein C4343_07000, partial [Chloroflexota bacterium]
MRASAAATRRGTPYEAIADALRQALAPLPEPELGALVGPGAEVVARLLPEFADRLRRLGLLPDRPSRLDPERRPGR